jgi:hypothetical protein
MAVKTRSGNQNRAKALQNNNTQSNLQNQALENGGGVLPPPH